MTIEANFVGHVNIPGDYDIVTSAIVGDHFFWIITRPEQEGMYELWKIDMNSAKATNISQIVRGTYESDNLDRITDNQE